MTGLSCYCVYVEFQSYLLHPYHLEMMLIDVRVTCHEESNACNDQDEDWADNGNVSMLFIWDPMRCQCSLQSSCFC